MISEGSATDFAAFASTSTSVALRLLRSGEKEHVGVCGLEGDISQKAAVVSWTPR